MVLACGGIAAVGCGGDDESAPQEPSQAANQDAGTEQDSQAGADAQQDAAEQDAAEPLPSTAFPWSSESTNEACSDGQDNDGNSYSDCDDFACSRNPAVFVCGKDSAYENSPEACSDGTDNDGDGLVDCADPDCAKNPFHDACPARTMEQGCGTGADTDGDGKVDCEDYDCLLTHDGCDRSAFRRVLFDLSLDETAADGPNSDWIVDRGGRYPSPSNPAGPNDWSGALSSFGYELFASGQYLIESLPSWSGKLTYGDSNNPQDLQHYDVLVLMEPSRQMTMPEKQAVLQFVAGGGGLLAVANHLDSDRDGNGFSSLQVFNDLFQNNPVKADPLGFQFDEVNINVSTPLARIENASHPVIQGPFGQVTQIGLYQGCSAHLTVADADHTALVQLDDAPDSASKIVVGAVQAGAGRVVFVTDSAIAGDGTDSHGNKNPAHDAWNDASRDNRVLMLNAVSWLAE